jgi:hypothetical protein
MEPSPDAVAIEVLDHTKPVLTRSPLDCSAQVAESSTGLSSVHGVTLREPCRLQEVGCNRRDIAHRNTDSGVGEVAIQLGRDVKIHQVAVTKLAL